MRTRRISALVASLLVVGAVGAVAQSRATHSARAGSKAAALTWEAQGRSGGTLLAGQVPLAVTTHAAARVQRHTASSRIELNFGFPLRDKAALDALIAQSGEDAPLPRAAPQLYARFSPPVGAGRRAARAGSRRTASRSRTSAPTGSRSPRPRRPRTVERALHVKINDYVRPGFTFHGLQGRAVPVLREHDRADGARAPRAADDLGAERRRPLLHAAPARRGQRTAADRADCGDDDDAAINPLCVDVRSGGYFPSDLRGALRHHRPRLRRHRPDDRLHAVDRRRAPGGDDRVRDRRPATSRSPSTRAASRRATRRRRRARARRRRSRPTTC